MSEFGKQLRTFREQSRHPATGKRLTQEALGECLKEEIGVRYTGAAISDWERGESKISADDRLLLLSLIKILKQYGGIESSAAANLLLEAGNYRGLNPLEREELFPGEAMQDDPPYPIFTPGGSSPAHRAWLDEHPYFGFEKISEAIKAESDGPHPIWPRVVVSLIRKTTDRLTAFDVLRAILWLWIFVITYFLVFPSLQWSNMAGSNAIKTVVLYTIGSIIIPPMIGGMTDTGKKAFWKEKELSRSAALHLYVHQGAYVGFHVGYFITFLFTFIQNLFGTQPITWFESIKIIIPITISYLGAQVIPYNLWRAYGRIHLKDGGIFFVFALLGPLWAWFFLEFHKILISSIPGAVIILMAVTILVTQQAGKGRK